MECNICLLFRQGIVVALLVYFGVIKGTSEWTVENVERGLQDFLIIIEMFLCSLAFYYAFGYSTFKNPEARQVLSEFSRLTRVKSNIAELATNMSPIAKNFVDVANVTVIIALNQSI
jgi:hypothetical protein